MSVGRRVVVSGIGIIAPVGIGVRAFWANLLAGQMGVRRVAAFDPSGFRSQVAGEVPPYKIGDFVPKSYRKAAKVMARDIELAVVAADDAFKDSGLKSKAYTDAPSIDSLRFGCNIGAGLISFDIAELMAAMTTARADGAPNTLDLVKWGRDGMSQLTPLWLLKFLPNMLACHVTIIHQLKGPSNTITCADASSHLAIGEAFRTIQRGKADLAICGGAQCYVNPIGMMRHNLLNRCCETHNDDPANAVRPFDAEACGMAVAEGAGLLILEELDHARARGAKIYAELVGFAASQDTYSVTDPDPSGRSYAQAVIRAMAEAQVSAGQIGCLVPHGLAIGAHDQAELSGLELALGGALATVPMAPIKAQIGNTSAGSGVDVAVAVLALHDNRVPPAVNTRKVRGGRALNVSTEARELNVNVSLTSVYSLGGQNAALVFRRL